MAAQKYKELTKILANHGVDARFVECTTIASRNGYNEFTLPLEDRRIMIQKVYERGGNRRTILTVTIPVLQKPFAFASGNGNTEITWDGNKFNIIAK